MDIADLPAVRAINAHYRRAVQANVEAQLRNMYPRARITCSDNPGGGFTVRSTSPYGDAKFVMVPQDPPEGVIRLVEFIREMHELAERAGGSLTASSEAG